MQERFLRLERLIGSEKLKKIENSHVIIVGLGSVGSFALETLARSGVRKFTLVDFDTVGLTNINRQILATESTLGKFKSDIAKDRVLDINPNCEVRALNMFAATETMEEIFKYGCTLLIDAIDSLNPKVSLLEYASKHNIKTISSMGAALRTDLTKIKWEKLYKTYGCPLAREVRSNLRKRDGLDNNIVAVFSNEKIVYEYKEPEDEDNVDLNEETLERGRKRRVLGSMPSVTGSFGLTIGHLAVQYLSGKQDIFKS